MEDNKLSVKINGEDILAKPEQTVLTVALSHNIYIPNLCFQKNLGILKTCDMCFVEVNGEMSRACATPVRPGMTIETLSSQVKEAQYEAMSRVLKNHDLYCTVCDNNNGNCEIHNTVRSLEIEHQRYVFQPKSYSADHSNPFYRYQPDQCILCGRCVEACQDLQVNETLTIDWNREAPRVLWDRDVPIDQSSCVSCGHCVTVCPCNALMEKSMLGEAGYLTGMPAKILEPVIELTKVVEPSYKQIFALSEMEAAMREARIKRTKTVCIYCGVGCSFEIWSKGRYILKVQPTVEAPVNAISTCVKGKFGWDFVNSKERLTKPLIRTRLNQCALSGRWA